MASLEFTDYGNASNGAFFGDFGNRDHILAGGAQLDKTAMLAADSFTVTVNDADVNAGETSFTVVALPGAIPAGTKLTFSDTTVAYVNADAAAAATSLTVYPLAADITNAATATYNPTNASTYVVPAGTLVGRTNAERLNGDKFGPAADADDEVFFTVNDVDLDNTIDVDLVRHGSLIKYNFLPVFSALSSTLKGKVYGFYDVIKG